MLNSIVNIKNVLKGCFLILSLLLFLNPTSTHAQEKTQIKSVLYFTGIGCPHCAKVAPVLHEKVNNNSNLLLVEYEIYQQTINAKSLNSYSNRYNNGVGIPLVLYNSPLFDLGDLDIVKNFDSNFENLQPDTFELPNQTLTLSSIDLNQIDGKPKLFRQNRVAYKNTNNKLTESENTLIRGFLLTDELDTYVSNLEGKKVTNLQVQTSAQTEQYDYGISIGSWNILWRGNPPKNTTAQNTVSSNIDEQNSQSRISLLKVGGLALTDSINPCALSVLLMMLVAITTYHPKDRKQVLLSGLAFIAAVFVTYFIYGLLLVKAFEVIQSFTTIRIYLYKGLAIGAILLGLLELKDFFFYKPGQAGTEMPLFLRPKVQNIIAKITSPLGAFSLGIFVTLFLLPCTIGPYIILGGMLSFEEFFQSMPYLAFYNLIFVLPMIIIVLLVFFGSKDIKQINKWKEKNIQILHLIIGLIFVLFGISMLLGWI